MKVVQFFTEACSNVQNAKCHSATPAQIQDNIDEPSECPMCHHGLKPHVLSAVYYKYCEADTNKERIYEACLYRCTRCDNIFFAQYEHGMGGRPVRTAPQVSQAKIFSEEISKLSPPFVKIYNQAADAENSGLDEICGMGYRKALEFLIKDYLISNQQNDQATIERMELGNCIANKVSFEPLKITASRAAWLGNDFAHYKRRFEDCDIALMKALIDISVRWIEAELITARAACIEPRR